MIFSLRRGSLFAKTSATIALVSLTFFIFTFALIALFIVLPLAQRSADSLASLMILAADTWERLPTEERGHYLRNLEVEHRLTIGGGGSAGQIPRNRHLPFFLLVEDALEKRLGMPVRITQPSSDAHRNDFWVAVPTHGGEVSMGFHYSHEDGMEPPVLLLLVLLVGTLATLATSVVLARRLTKPLERLARATLQVGTGERMRPLPESEPLELAELVRSFNDMAQQVQDLIANRTTLLAGISHDLRTPLTRMELAVEMLGNGADPALVAGLRQDLAQMNRLIGLFLEISKGLQEEQRQTVEIAPLLSELVEDFRRQGATLEWHPCTPACARTIHPLALRRIVNNLLENAVRYGGGHPIELHCRPDGERLIVEVLDRGPGIPEDQREAVFRPFHRLEQSRSSATGGSGLGLAIVRQLAQANRCAVELFPREGGGTCARITIA